MTAPGFEVLLQRLLRRRADGSRVPSVRTDDRRVTLDVIAARAGGVARGIRACAQPPGPGSGTVLVEATDAIELLVGALGAYVHGQSVIVIDPRAPSASVRRMVAAAEAIAGPVLAFLPVASRHAELLATLEIPTIPVQADADPLAEMQPVPPDRPAGIAFTSGSTGDPVAHLRTRAHTARKLNAPIDGVRRNDRFGMLLGATTSALRRMLEALLMDADVICLDARRCDPQEILEIMAEERVTVLSMIPSYLRPLLQVAESERLPDLRLVISGSEALDWRDVVRIRERLSSRAVILHTYGATEVGGRVAMRRIAPEEAPGVGAVPVGTPPAGVKVVLVDAEGNEAPVDEPGLVTVRRADGSVTSLRDLARWNADGELELLGRSDRVRKSGGIRVDLAQIERHVRGIAGIAEVVAVLGPQKDAGGTGAAAPLLVHVVTEDAAKDVAVVRSVMESIRELDFVRGVDVEIRVHAALPRLTNGKPDLKLLEVAR